MILTTLGAMLSWLRDATAWLDMATTSQPLTMQTTVTGDQWAQFGVSALVWVAVPLVLGIVRILRREVN